MALNELLKRGYWAEAGDTPNAGVVEGAGDVDDINTDNLEKPVDEPQSMAEAISQSIHSQDEPSEPKVPADESKNEEVSSLPDSDAIVDKNKDDDLAEPDPYEPPEDLEKSSKKTQERFHDLVEKNKEKDTRLTELKTENENIISMISSTGATAEQFGSLINLSALMYHPDKADPKAAVDSLYAAASKIAKSSGIDLPGFDPLEGHDDLRTQVDGMEIGLDAAKELAQSRNVQSVRVQQDKEKEQMQESQQRSSQRAEEGKNAVTKYLLNLQNTDIDFEAKAQHLMDAVSGISKTVPPEQWVEHLDRHYKTVNNIIKSAPKIKEASPLRSGGGSGGNKAPASMQEAISQSLQLGSN